MWSSQTPTEPGLYIRQSPTGSEHMHKVVYGRWSNAQNPEWLYCGENSDRAVDFYPNSAWYGPIPDYTPEKAPTLRDLIDQLLDNEVRNEFIFDVIGEDILTIARSIGAVYKDGSPLQWQLERKHLEAAYINDDRINIFVNTPMGTGSVSAPIELFPLDKEYK